MDIQFLIDNLTEGLPADQAAIVKAAIERDAVKAKAGSWKNQQEAAALDTRLAAMQQELEGDAAQGKLGAKAYADWYQKNSKNLEVLLKAQKDYITKYGKFEGTFEAPVQTQQTQQQQQLDEAAVQRLVDSRIQSQYAPNWSNLMVGFGKVVQKHMFSGRKSPIDMDVVSKLAVEKYQNNLEAAYDEWDKPEREKATAAERESEIKRRVDEELQKRGASAHFPAGADLTQGTLAARTKADTDKYDKTALARDLAKDWMTAGSN